jgi:hypothetical protein
MKTNHVARQIVRIRRVVSLIAFVALVGSAACLGGSLATRFGQTSAVPTSLQQPAGNWNVSISLPDLSMLAR